MLAELGIIPDVFDKSTYSSPEHGEGCLDQLLGLCREEAVVRDFCNGRWSEYVSKQAERWHVATKEILETLGKEGRLRPFPQACPNTPEEDKEWYYEAVAAHDKSPLDLILAGSPAQLECEDDSKVTPITKLSKSAWWQRRSPSVRLRRQTAEYLRYLRPVLKRAASFMFIDAHIDEREKRYAEFCQVFRELGGQRTKPRIEIHIWQGKGIPSIADWRGRLQNSARTLAKSKMTAQVCVWPVNFHDRFLITDVVGINLSNGFDIATGGAEEATWNRLGREDREKVELTFEPNAGRYGMPNSFLIGISVG